MADRQAQRFARVSEIAMGLPEVRSETVRTHTQYLARTHRIAWHLVDHHGNGRVEMQTRGIPGENAALADAHPDRYFLPPYMARHGWIGLWLDLPKVDWDEVEGLLVASYRIQAPKTLVKQLDA